jgi:hypothetical protein
MSVLQTSRDIVPDMFPALQVGLSHYRLTAVVNHSHRAGHPTRKSLFISVHPLATFHVVVKAGRSKHFAAIWAGFCNLSDRQRKKAAEIKDQ